jgi:hypothetical protein
MKGMPVVLQSDVGDILHSKGFLIVAIIIGVLTVGTAVGVPISLNRWFATGLAWGGGKAPVRTLYGASR